MQSKKILGVLALSVMFFAARHAQAATVLSDSVICAGQTFNFPEGGNEVALPLCGSFAIPDFAVLFKESASDPTISDQIYSSAGFFYFASDPNLQTITQPVVGVLVETGLFQDVSSFFGLAAGTIQIESDAADPAPEPMTLMLAAPAVAFFGYRRLRARA